MNFHRSPVEELLGDLDVVRVRFGGDQQRSLDFLSVHQGAYILAAIRDAGFTVPVLFSYDFEVESRRWEQLVAKYGNLNWVGDNAGPDQVRAALIGLIAQ
jgi:nuclear transport factor 2 (NTF2) superfamily protein